LINPYEIALIYMGLGRKDRALEWLEKAFHERCVPQGWPEARCVALRSALRVPGPPYEPAPL